MNHRLWTIWFLSFIAAVAVYVWFSSADLPHVMGSHFNAAGQADAYMPRNAYRNFYVGLMLGLPLLVVFLPNALIRRTTAAFNLPHRDYWLAPERRARTVDVLCRMSFGFGYLLVGFLGYVHWLVIRANHIRPPGFPSDWFISGLIVFIGSVILWMFLHLRRFFRVPQSGA
ncbi:MAG: DUF1648 domain-containing protein [Gammaproteobacteria bacterium]|nr:DUF1648 domain-containing protein [Gammaproteobacteria bacterium]